MSLFKLIIHSFRLSQFSNIKYSLDLSNVDSIIILESHLGILSVFFQISIVIFNILIFIVSQREQSNLFNSHNNLDSVKKSHTKSCIRVSNRIARIKT